MPRFLGERTAAKLLRDDDSDEVGFAAWQAPDLLEHGVDASAAWVERLESRLAAGHVEPTRPDAGIRAVARDVDRAEPVGRDRARKGERPFSRGIELLDNEQGAVPGARRRRDRRGSGC